jgi:hypothetical protein
VSCDALDQFLADVLRCALGRAATPSAWPADWPDTDAFLGRVMGRIGFHGIALALLRNPDLLSGWPQGTRDALRAEARAQTFWELGHREVAIRLIDALAGAGVESIVTKGTALAYTVYPDPAMRRRGDSDLLLPASARKGIGRLLKQSGFRRSGDIASLQESWAADCRMGFTHEFDLHWRVNASPVLSDALERGGVGTRSIPLPRLHEKARGLAPVDNLVMIAINRASHRTFGYYVDNVRQFDEDRLIWALDVDLTCSTFGETQWHEVLGTARATRMAPVILSTLAFAEERLGTPVPAPIKTALAEEPRDAAVLRYFDDLPGLERLRMNLAACPTLPTKLEMVRHTLFPRSESMRERFPDTADWPLVALYARRMWSGLRPHLRRDG